MQREWDFNVGMSKPSRPAGGLWGDVSPPAGYGAAPRSKQYVSKYFHGFFITINSMILYFKHIIHIDDFPLNGHPPSVYYVHSQQINTPIHQFEWPTKSARCDHLEESTPIAYSGNAHCLISTVRIWVRWAILYWNPRSAKLNVDKFKQNAGSH